MLNNWNYEYKAFFLYFEQLHGILIEYQNQFFIKFHVDFKHLDGILFVLLVQYIFDLICIAIHIRALIENERNQVANKRMLMKWQNDRHILYYTHLSNSFRWFYILNANCVRTDDASEYVISLKCI